MNQSKINPGDHGNGEKAPTFYTSRDIITLLKSVEHDPVVNRRANVHQFKELYKKRGEDLDAWYQSRATTANHEAIQQMFIESKHNSFASSLAETLPLFANQPGRLGDYIEANVTKTAKADDQGNSFIDFVIEIKNNWIANGAPRELQDVPARMTFLVDVTTGEGGDKFLHKIEVFRKKILDRGEKASVKCYQNSSGDLGIERPKIIISEKEDYIQKVGGSLGGCISQLAADKYIITRPAEFNEWYRDYFLNLIDSIETNALSNISYIKQLKPDSELQGKREALIREYEKIIKFAQVYKKTPVTKKRGV